MVFQTIKDLDDGGDLVLADVEVDQVGARVFYVDFGEGGDEVIRDVEDF